MLQTKIRMQIRLRTLFLITTVVALVVFSFTLGIAEGIFALFFFATLFGSSNKNRRIATSAMLLALLVGLGLSARIAIQRNFGQSNEGYYACVGIYFTNADQKRQGEVMSLLENIFPHNKTGVSIESFESRFPFFRTGTVKLHLDNDNLDEIEAKVRQQLDDSFPNLTVEIQGLKNE